MKLVIALVVSLGLVAAACGGDAIEDADVVVGESTESAVDDEGQLVPGAEFEQPVELYEFELVEDRVPSIEMNACHPDEAVEVEELVDSVVVTVIETIVVPEDLLPGEDVVRNECSSFVEVTLDEPLGERVVIDGSTGAEVEPLN